MTDTNPTDPAARATPGAPLDGAPKPERGRFTSIRAKLLAFVIPLVLISTFAVFSIFEYMARQAASEQLSLKLDRTVEIQGAVLAESIWNVADEQIGLILDALITDSDVIGAIVFDEDGREIAAIGEVEGLEDRPFFAGSDIMYGGFGDEQKIGHLAIALTDANLATQAQGRLILALVLASILLTAIVSGILLANRRIIGQPIALLIDSIEHQGTKGAKTRVAWESQDEIGSVVRAFNNMQSRQEAYERELQASHDQLERRVAARTAELAQAEELANAARKQLHDAIESISEGFAIYDAENTLKLANRRYREVMHNHDPEGLAPGTPLDAVLSRAFDSGVFMHHGVSEADWVAAQMARISKVGEPYLLEMTEDRWQRVSNRRTEEGGIVSVSSDISELKQIQDELQRAKEQAEAANDAKGAFLATMSHEIRTPLNGIVGMSNLLDGTALTVEQREFSATIKSAADTLLTIINDILDFSKVEAGALELEKIPMHLGEVVEDSAELVASKANEKNLEMACRIELDVPRGILGDPTRLKQILMNLLNNAVKFTEQGEVVLKVSSVLPAEALTEGDSTLLKFQVSDTGIGIPPERMDRLFKSFSQVDASTTRQYGGTGLGLVITKRLVELMGGQISVESEEGKGTTFSFTLPCVTATLPNRKSRERQLDRIRGARVLVVDDNRTNRLILNEKLSSWEIECQATGDPREALSWIEGGARFDVCVFDYKMPYLNGLELSRRAMTVWGAEKPPLILFTSISSFEPAFKEAVDEIGFSSVLSKPAKSNQLRQALAQALTPEAEAEPSVEVFDARAPTAAANPLSILLVDDNAINRKVATKTLKRLGYESDVACDGHEAVEMATAGSYDLVFMDIEMPGMDGITATGKLRALIPDHEMPYIVALTANAMASERDRYLQSGMDGYLSKPIDLDALKKCLTEAHQRRDH
ncbi:response regulator [Dinoroseobacter sp. S375]|uniref:response regulator n=1 Tax=Dinoroseobacter sp. S375 TaxID=3415136 RepID=UPI003C7C58F4